LAVLDLGCGAGEDVRALAALVGPRGRVVGVDWSSIMIAEAIRRHGTSGLPVEFLEGDAQALSLPDASFDRCRSERMLMHLDDPERALAELARFLRPGGRMAVFDVDWDTFFFDSPDKEITRKIIHACSDSIKSGWIGPRLPRLFQAIGLTDTTHLSHTIRLDYAFTHRLLDGMLASAQAAGLLSADALEIWWNHLAAAEAAGLFFGGCLGFVVAGTKP
jgi:ubiquinone/menaquinone biosynthesis C-methylase UbiE